MRPCNTCGAPNPEDKTTCYACKQSLTTPPPMASQPPPPAGHSYPQQPYPQQQYPPQQYPQQHPPQAPMQSMPQGYAPQPQSQGYAPPAPGMVPQYAPHTAAAPAYFNPAEAARDAQIILDYRVITRRLLLSLVVSLVCAFLIIFAFKDQQTILGLPRILWASLPLVGMAVFAGAICRCPGCKASLIMRNDVNETGQCPFCNARLK